MGGENGVGVGDIVILASWNYHFIRVHENLVHHPSNYISIYKIHQLHKLF